MIRFPETLRSEWKILADAAKVERELRKRIERDTLIEREVERIKIRHYATQNFQQELDSEFTPALEMGTLANYHTGSVIGPSDLIEGVMKDKGLVIFLGPSGSGKSTTGLQMLYCLLTGEEFLGQPVQKISGAVGAMSYDMDGGLMMDWIAGFPNVDPHKVSVVNAHKRGNPLGVPALRAQIASAWRAMQVEVVIIDSFSASFFGQDQNDAAATMHHYRDMLLFALTEVGAKSLIVIVHSTDSNPRKARGSTVHHDVADTIISQWIDPKSQQRHIDMTKYRQHRDANGHFTSQMKPIVITAPDSVTHLVGLDLGAMTLAGMQLPTSQTAAAFTAMPDTIEEPDTDSEDGEDDNL